MHAWERICRAGRLTNAIDTSRFEIFQPAGVGSYFDGEQVQAVRSYRFIPTLDDANRPTIIRIYGNATGHFIFRGD